MARYWSEAVRFNVMQLARVAPTKDPDFLTADKILLVIVLSIPVASIVPPNTMALRMSQSVFNIPFIPPLENNELMSSFEVSIEKPPKLIFMTNS